MTALMKRSLPLVCTLLLVSTLGCGSSSGGTASGNPAVDGGADGSEGVPADAGGNPGEDATSSNDGAATIDATTPTEDTGVHPDGGNMPASDGDTGTDASGTQCSRASDCMLFSDYCGGCTCLALAVGQAAPYCDAGTVSCLKDPCSGETAACNALGTCIAQP
jgi:hypothetical protein